MKNPKQHFTHYAWFYGVPCYFNFKTGAFDGRGAVSKFFLRLALNYHYTTSNLPPFFSINVGDTL